MASATAADPSLVNGTEVRAGGSSRDGDLEEEESGNGQREEVVEAPQGYQHGSGAGGLSTEDLQKVVAAVAAALSGAGHGRGTTFNTGRMGEDENRVLLEKKFFRNMDKFEEAVEA